MELILEASLEVSINGALESLPANTTLEKLIHQHNPTDLPIAVAINAEFVPRSQYATTPLNAGDKVDIVSPVGGG